MSALDFAPPGSGGITPVQPGTTPSFPSTGAELRGTVKRTGRYQGSMAKSNLMETAAAKLLEELPAQDRAEIEGRIQKYKAERDSPDHFGPSSRRPLPQPLDYAEMYKAILDETSPLSHDALYAAAKDELVGATRAETAAKANTISEWPTTQALAGGMQAGFEDPLELAGMGVSLVAGLASGGSSVAAEVGVLGLDVAGAAAVTASYQPAVIKLYKEMGLEDIYGPFEALVTVGAGAVLNVGMYGAGRAAGWTAKKAAKAVTAVAKKRNQLITEGADPRALDAALPTKIREIEAHANTRAVTGDPSPHTTEPAMAQSKRVNDAMHASAEGRGVDPYVSGDARAPTGRPASALEVTELSDGVGNPAAAIDVARAMDGEPFKASTARAAVIAGGKEKWLADMAADINRVPPPDPKRAAEVEARGKVLAQELKSLRGDLRSFQDASKADPGKHNVALAWHSKAIQKNWAESNAHAMNAKGQAKRAKLIKQRDELAKSNTVPPQYARQVRAETDLARGEHKARASAKGGAAGADEAATRIDDALMDMGALPDTRPARPISTKAVDLDNPDAYVDTPDDIAAKEYLAENADPEEIVTFADEDYKQATSTVGEMLKEAADLDAMHAVVKECF
jgi:hypothetical protein